MLGAWAPRKRRTREHILGDLGVNHVERQGLLCGFSLERIRGDYGYDLVLFTYTAAGEPEVGHVLFQVKATERVKVLKGRAGISFRLEAADLRLWLTERAPVILALYNAEADEAYWVDVQAFFADQGKSGVLPAFGTKTIHLPLSNRLDARGMREIARLKNDFVVQQERSFPS